MEGKGKLPLEGKRGRIDGTNGTKLDEHKSVFAWEGDFWRWLLAWENERVKQGIKIRKGLNGSKTELWAGNRNQSLSGNTYVM
ncbi:hypothetical protein Goshw_009992 [Gossypium schwendimanii]|uniref:Uncharacterized protein n=2 Tax=Gossypium TaxID=3633 RepID=A0A7J9L933_GOSSC|nr:hypothetical protein [Gossypium schwendimanii]